MDLWSFRLELKWHVITSSVKMPHKRRARRLCKYSANGYLCSKVSILQSLLGHKWTIVFIIDIANQILWFLFAAEAIICVVCTKPRCMCAPMEETWFFRWGSFTEDDFVLSCKKKKNWVTVSITSLPSGVYASSQFLMLTHLGRLFIILVLIMVVITTTC